MKIHYHLADFVNLGLFCRYSSMLVIRAVEISVYEAEAFARFL